MPDNRQERDLTIRIGGEELQIRQRYEVLSILNDLGIGVLFLVGSVLFLHDSTVYMGTWLFIIGSALLLIRPAIRLARRVHLSRIGTDNAVPARESSMDF